jgi:hypothetical protein
MGDTQLFQLGIIHTPLLPPPSLKKSKIGAFTCSYIPAKTKNKIEVGVGMGYKQLFQIGYNPYPFLPKKNPKLGSECM